MQDVDPKRDPAPEVEGGVPGIFAQAGEEGAALVIEREAEEGADEDVAHRGENGIIIGGVDARVQPIGEEEPCLAAGEACAVFVGGGEGVVDGDDRNPEDERDCRRAQFFMAAERVDEPPEQNGDGEHMQDAEADGHV